MAKNEPGLFPCLCRVKLRALELGKIGSVVVIDGKLRGISCGLLLTTSSNGVSSYCKITGTLTKKVWLGEHQQQIGLSQPCTVHRKAFDE